MSSQQIMSSAEPSICIPRVFMNITKERILTVFTELFGDERAIDHIDMVEKASPNGDKYQRVFVHFRQWPTTRDAQEMRRQLLDNKDVKIVYDDPWFWKCSASHAKRPDARETNKPRGPYIMMNNDDSRRDNQSQSQSQTRYQRDDRPREYESRPRYQPEDRQRDRQQQERPRYQPDERQREYQPRRQQQDERQREYQPRQQQDERRDNYSVARTHHKPTYQPSSSSRPVITRRPKLKIDVSCTDAEASQTLETVTTNTTSTSADVPGSPPYNPTTPPTTPPKLQTEAPGAPKKIPSTRTKFIITSSDDDE
jgi:hypothetical protein